MQDVTSRPLSQPLKPYPAVAGTGAASERKRMARRLSLARWLGLALLLPGLVAALTAPYLAPYDPFANSGPSFQPP